MLAKRIIPCLDVRAGRVVKGKKFMDIVDVEDPITLAKRYSDLGADELVFYDITASSENRKTQYDYVKGIAKEVNIPFSVGGGVSSVEDVGVLVRLGADKVSVNTAAVLNPMLIKEASDKFGTQCIVLSMDVKETQPNEYKVFTHGGRNQTSLDAVEWAVKAVALGAGEIVVNAMDNDGMKDGYNMKLLKAISSRVNVPIIASGGAGTIEHFIEAAKGTVVDGLLAASVFHYGEISISDLKERLRASGIPVRIEGGLQ